MSLDQGFYRLRIAELRRETPDAVSIAFDISAALRDTFAFTPGQYLTFRATLAGEEIRRSYSICSGLDDGELRVGIKHVPGGVFSRHANTVLQPGDMVETMPPEGRFGAAIAKAEIYAAFAAGSGITPVLSILKTVLARQPDSRFILFYGNRATPQIMFRGTLEALKDRYLDRLSLVHVLSREEQDIPVFNGRLDAAKIRHLLPHLADPTAIAHAFVCGPADMIDTLPPVLHGLGVGRVHTERFTPSGSPLPPRPAPAADAIPFATATIIHDGKTSEVPVAQGEAVLEAALRAGLDLPWSCRGGMCSTCRARLRDGEVAMTRNYALEPWETEAGFVLTCQSHPLTPHVTVDYDQV